MTEYNLEKTQTIDVDNVIKNTTSLKDLFNIEFIEDTDNIALVKAICFRVFQKADELESRIKNLEKK